MRSMMSAMTVSAGLTLALAGCMGEVGGEGQELEDVSATRAALVQSGWFPVPGGLFKDAPGITSRRPGDLVVVGRGLDDAAYWSVRDNNGNWNGFSSIGSKTFRSKLAIGSIKSTATEPELVVTGLGMDGKPWYATKLPGSATFGDWLPLPGGKTFTGAPAITGGFPTVVFPDAGGTLWASTNLAFGANPFWTGWERIPLGNGIVQGEAAMWKNGFGDIILTARDRDNFYYTTQYRAGSGWNGSWNKIFHHTFNSAPAIAGWSDNNIIVSGAYSQSSGTLINYVQSADRGSTWTRSVNMPTKSFVSAPSMWSWGPNHVDTVALASDRMYYLNTIDF